MLGNVAKWRLYVLLLLGLLCSQAFAGEPIKLMTEDFAPFQYYEDGKLTGLSTEVMQALQQEVGHTDSIVVYPWSRGLRLLERKKNSALFSTMKTPEREKKFKWVGPLTELRVLFFKKTGSPINRASVEEAVQDRRDKEHRRPRAAD